MSEGSELQLFYPKVTTLNFQREPFMIKGVIFSMPPKGFLKLVLTLIYNHGSTCINIISFTCLLYIKKYGYSFKLFGSSFCMLVNRLWRKYYVATTICIDQNSVCSPWNLISLSHRSCTYMHTICKMSPQIKNHHFH